MTLDSALTLFRRLGVDVQALSRAEFSSAYFSLARRYHPDHNSHTADLMANINMARTCILRSFRWPSPSEAAANHAKASARTGGDTRAQAPRVDLGKNGRPIFGRRVWAEAAQG